MNKILIAIILTTLSCFARATPWGHGKINITESFDNSLQIRWTGPNQAKCGNNTVLLTKAALGGEEAFDRAFKIALTATVSGKPIRFKLEGCSNNYQIATVVQLCANNDCSY